MLLIYVVLCSFALAAAEETKFTEEEWEYNFDVEETQFTEDLESKIDQINQTDPLLALFVPNGYNAPKRRFYVRVFVNLGGGRTSNCGGSIISSKYVLTAGHCITKGKPVHVLVGDFTKRQPKYKEIIGTGIVHENTFAWGRKIWASNYRSLSSFRYKAFHDDIAVIKLKKRVSSSLAIKLCTKSYKDSTKYSFLVTGMGMDSATGNPDVLQEGKVQETIKSCKLDFNPKNQVCTVSSRNGPKSCPGDSGGPLFLAYKSNIKKDKCLYGIVSYGPSGCRNGESTSVFTRVSAYQSWIKKRAKWL